MKRIRESSAQDIYHTVFGSFGELDLDGNRNIETGSGLAIRSILQEVETRLGEAKMSAQDKFETGR